jgi:ActR/RegA family two-component response regulator
MKRSKLLFVDDDESSRQMLPVILTENGFDVTTVATVAEAISEINRQPFDILLSDLNIGQPGDGFTVVSAMRRIQPQARTYLLTGYPDFDSALEAIRRQVDDYLTKRTRASAHRSDKFLVFFPVSREFLAETGSQQTASTASIALQTVPGTGFGDGLQPSV